MRSYEAARSLFSFLGFMAWSVIIIGVIVAVIGMAGASRYGGGSAALIAMIPGISIGISGFILLAFVQMGRATVDTAEYTQQMLKIARDQLEVSNQSLKQGERIETGFGALKQPEPAKDKASFADRVEKPERKKKKKKTKAPVETIAATTAVELGAETADTITTEPPQLEETHAVPLPELPVEPAAELAPEIVRIDEAIPEPEPEIIQEPIPEPKPQSFEHKGRTIEHAGHKFSYNGIEFISLELAQSYIDNFAITPAKKLPGATRST